jgi:hypothetical protein
LAQIEDENANDMRSSHGLDAASVSNWVNETHGNMEPGSDNLIRPVTDTITRSHASVPNIAPVTVSEIPNPTSYSLPFGTATHTSSTKPTDDVRTVVPSSQLANPGWNFPAVSNIVSGIRTVCSVAASAVSSRFSVS